MNHVSHWLVVALALITFASSTVSGCDRGTPGSTVVEPTSETPKSTDTGTDFGTDSGPGAVTEVAPQVDTASRWTALRDEHGDNLLEVSFTDARGITYEPHTGNLVVEFDWPMVQGADSIEPERVIDYKAVARSLGATKVADVPRDFMMSCGINHGGNFDAGGVTYGIYISGGCHHVRIFDASPDAVRLLLGEDFLPLLDGCNAEVGPVCRTATELKARIIGEPAVVRARAEKGGAQLARVEGTPWWSATLETRLSTRPFESLVVANETMTCLHRLDELAEPAACELDGPTFNPDDPCPNSGSCRREGLCVFVEGDCRATHQLHCDQSLDCANQAECTFAEGECVATEQSCKDHRICQHQGRCALIDGSCQATDAHCATTEECKEKGACSAFGGGCRPANSADCKKSRTCRDEGNCGLAPDGRCKQMTAPDCRRSSGCKDRGYCNLAPDGVGCSHCWTLDPRWPKDAWTWANGKCRKKGVR